jgi:hypothetical protein
VHWGRFSKEIKRGELKRRKIFWLWQVENEKKLSMGVQKELPVEKWAEKESRQSGH